MEYSPNQTFLSNRVNQNQSSDLQLTGFLVSETAPKVSKLYRERIEYEVPVLVKASTSLILGFAPVIPTYMFDASIHPCV